MKIRFIENIMSPGGSYPRGKIIDLPEKEARYWIEQDMAISVEPPVQVAKKKTAKSRLK
jgi:hypothetical protein